MIYALLILSLIVNVLFLISIRNEIRKLKFQLMHLNFPDSHEIPQEVIEKPVFWGSGVPPTSGPYVPPKDFNG